ncbi:FMN-binding protein [Streptomyces europaeiscabiei]|uniref:FMN-binding protein n=1 Tax=Streptomyces europaeiscabiei TaxID=146819 RepID=A0ABU4NRG7_9ACTN|nr:FMN-binding protein [Streptomyces europaeiscabiei]MDX2528162.1 FMN-binding protein [Streptomyces europaeiscabiei]MDX2763325.1 FMN-binding protein [Streptomyces europaeiscabiei]MDX2773149.1 FMN-binding protein [Streptomyces europaeiscabiei]MDX3547429.1 FMN-binding protein [Streptomyces europaeiscabiei]MDX3557865.1 FMN-binding protein [Streptomyces europaeiscabiei]
MKRVIPALVLSAAALVPVWRYAPSTDTTSTTTTAESTPSASASAAAGSNVVTGTTIDTEKGPVQVQATFRGEKITAVRMLQQPDHPQTEAAVPVLIEETLEAQSADIDTVSGATLTSDGYRESLQAAIDENEKSASSSADESSSSSASGDSEDSSASQESASRTVAGSTVGTSKGDVQVQVTFEGEKITAVEMLKQPNHPQTEAAVPVLIKETLEAQSADIDTVSGATITSDGYRESLQAAIDTKA